MARIFTVSIFVETETKPTVATFDAKDVKKAVEGKIRGLYLNIQDAVTNFQASLKSLLVPITGATNQFYLPYRSIPSPISLTTPSGQGSYLSLQLQQGDKFFSIKIVFEYDTDWEVITPEELTTLAGWLNSLRVDRINTVSGLKATAIQYANDYITNKNSLEAAQKGVAGLEAQITTSNTAITTLQKEMADNDAAIKTLLAQIATKEQNLILLKNQQTTAMGNVSQDDQQLAAQTQTLKTLTLQKDSGVADTSAFQNQMNINKDGFTSTLNALREEYAGDYSVLENARKAVFDTSPPNLSSCNSYLNQATPSY